MSPTPTPLLAFHSDPKIKSKFLRRVRLHAKADEIVSGQYWENGQGCAVGCTIHGSSHAAYENELGIPQVLAHLEDRLFEGMFRGNPVTAKAWPERFLSAPQPGADLSRVWPKFMHWMLIDFEHGVIQFAKTERSKKPIGDVAALYLRWVNGDKPAAKEWAADAAADAAQCKHFCIMADKLIELMVAA